MFPIVTIDSGYNEPKLVRKPNTFRDAFLAAATPQLPTPESSVVSSFVEKSDEPELKLSDFLDIPSLVSDDEEDLSDAESSRSGKFHEAKSQAAEVKRFVKESVKDGKDQEVVSIQNGNTNSATQEKEKDRFSPAEFAAERQRVMKIVIKYISMKISNSFPPEAPRAGASDIPLESFLMILVSRLRLTLPMFMKGIIYLFRYMDIIYLLRYLNQSNNFANYTDMGFGIKKLIIGCFRLALARAHMQRDWSRITGLPNAEINTIVKAVVRRLNGKLVIKNVEVVRLKMEIFRFVKMVATTV